LGSDSFPLENASAFEAPFLVAAEEYPPYEYLEGGVPVGLDVDILKAAAARAGIALLFEFLPWARAEDAAEKGEVDAIICLFKTKARESYLYFPTTPLSLEQNRIFSGPGYSGDPTDLRQLEGERILVCASYSYGAAFDSCDYVIKEEQASNETLIRMLAAGRRRFGIMNRAVAAYLIKKLGLRGIRELPIDLGSDPLYVGFSKASGRGRALFEKLAPVLKAMQEDGSIELIRKRYLP
jgi:polar amino acid transport system substrate-binding protein